MASTTLPACSARARFRPTLSVLPGRNMWGSGVPDESAGRFALSTSEPGRTGMLPSESQP